MTLIIDGNNIMSAAFFKTEQYPDDIRSQECNKYFSQRVNQTIELFNADKTYIAWDGLNSSAWRKTIFPEYKGKRKPKPEMLKICMSKGTETNFNHLKIENAEGDDTIYGLCRAIDDHKVILSADEDFVQLVQQSLCDKVYNPLTNRFREIPVWDIVAEKSVCGDVSDNLKGIHNVGIAGFKKLWENNMKGLTTEQLTTYRKHRLVVGLNNNPQKDLFLSQIKTLLEGF